MEADIKEEIEGGEVLDVVAEVVVAEVAEMGIGSALILGRVFSSSSITEFFCFISFAWVH